MSLCVVTGASRGIGRATALGLADAGWELALLARPSAALDETLQLLAERSARHRLYHCDLTDSQQLAAAARSLRGGQGVPDAVIHVAGVIERAPLEELDALSWDRQLHVNLRAPALLTRELLPGMKQNRRGRIIFVGSISSTLGTARSTAYNASKWGVVGLMKSLAEELRDSGLMTVAVLPGSVDTAMLQGSGFQPRMTSEDVACTLLHYATVAPISHNGGVVEMFGV